jgi:hypothetical protein
VVTEEPLRVEIVVIPYPFELATSVQSKIEEATRLDDAADSLENAA